MPRGLFSICILPFDVDATALDMVVMWRRGQMHKQKLENEKFGPLETQTRADPDIRAVLLLPFMRIYGPVPPGSNSMDGSVAYSTHEYQNISAHN
jgi:hypothetical protein